jgi:hypothetical protein
LALLRRKVDCAFFSLLVSKNQLLSSLDKKQAVFMPFFCMEEEEACFTRKFKWMEISLPTRIPGG